MKKNDPLFVSPQRQSQYAIIFIVLKFLRRLVGQLWPILLALILGRSGSSRYEWIELAAGGVGILGMISSIAAYYKYYYHITDTDLIIQKGIFKKTKLNIPFERIQSINFNQNFIHQFFNVTEIEIETAGSNKKELDIDALTMETAEALRTILLHKKALALNESHELIEENAEELKESPIETILELETKDLLKVGLTQNHFKPIGLLFGLVGSGFAYGWTFDMNPIDLFGMVEDQWVALSYIQSLALIVMLIPLMVLFSIITTFLSHYKLRFWRQDQKFQVVQGLLTKKQFAAIDKKIQILSWGQNPFQRLIGLFYVHFRQARSGDKDVKKAQFRIPGCDAEKIGFIRKAWLNKSVEFTEYHKVSMHYFIHFARNISIVALLVIGINGYFENYSVAGFLFFCYMIAVGMTWLSYKKKRYALNDHHLYVGGGALGLSHSILPAHKIQNMTITQNPYQSNRDLATLVVHSAAGSINIPYVNLTTAERLLDYFTYSVETSQKGWM